MTKPVTTSNTGASVQSTEAHGADVPPRGGGTADDHAHAVGVDLRVKAIARMQKMNLQQGQQAWQRRRTDPLSPHGLAFFYVYPGLAHWFNLAARTRLWLAEPETIHLPTLLFSLHEHVKELLRHGPFDPRQQLVNQPKYADRMPEQASFYGLGLSSLDTHSGSWAQACQTLNREEDVPGEIVIALTDGTLMVCQRRGKAEYNQVHVYATHPIELTKGRAPYPCALATAEELLHHPDPDVTRARGFLLQLHETLWSAEFARLARRAPDDAGAFRGGDHGR